MPEINQYSLTHKELLELLIKQNHVHEGKWSLLLGMAISSGMFGPTPEQTFPGVAVSFNQIGIQRVAPGKGNQGPGTVVLDAGVVNPKSKPKNAPKKKAKR